jgi:hypothetical protein
MAALMATNTQTGAWLDMHIPRERDLQIPHGLVKDWKLKSDG